MYVKKEGVSVGVGGAGDELDSDFFFDVVCTSNFPLLAMALYDIVYSDTAWTGPWCWNTR